MWYGHGMGGWAVVLMALTTITFWGVAGYGLVLLARYLTRVGGTAGAQSPTSDSILAERYARGEIDDEEYRRRYAMLHPAQ